MFKKAISLFRIPDSKIETTLYALRQQVSRYFEQSYFLLANKYMERTRAGQSEANQIDDFVREATGLFDICIEISNLRCTNCGLFGHLANICPIGLGLATRLQEEL